MQRLLGLLFILLYSAETLLCPLQDFTSLKCLPQIYHQCQAEDPDMDATDFVFEHLLNLECVMAYFEKDHSAEKNDKPHQPFQQLQSLSQTPVIINKSLQIEKNTAQAVTFYTKTVYPLCPGGMLSSNFLTEVFRPPSA